MDKKTISFEEQAAAPDDAIEDSTVLEKLIALQRAVLCDIALDQSFEDVLLKLCRLIEEMTPGGLASVMLKHPSDGLMYVAAGPSFPNEAVERLQGLRTEVGYGSCGSAAATGRPMFVCNAMEDPRWEHLRTVAKDFGIGSCWSYPIKNETRQVVGTFAITSLQQMSPTAFHRRLLQDASYLAGIAIRHHEQSIALSASERRLKQWAAAVENTTEGVIITNAQGRILDVNQAFSKITGYSRDEVRGRFPSILRSGRHSEDFYQQMWAALTTHGCWQGEVWNRRKNGEIYPEWLSVSRIENADDDLAHFVGVFADLSSIKAAEQELAFLAHHDPLTGLPNRLLFSARLEHAIERARREQGQIAVMFLDLDRFKTINDTLGHAAGDQLIKGVAKRLRDNAREQDTVARMGGDEFTLVLEDLGHADQAGSIALKLQQVLKEPFELDDRKVYVGASIGISLFPGDGQDADSLLKHSDAAMYRAKEQGRNLYAYYTADISNGMQERFRLENDLRLALVERQIQVWYQPQVDSRNNCIVGAEALLRWQHPQHGMIPPDRFIPIAEETGLIVELGLWVLRQACTQLKHWQQTGMQAVRLAVNLSGFQLIHSDLCQDLKSVLTDTGLSAEQLELEVTESFAMSHADKALAELDRIKALGVSLAIDDFGIGHSSLGHLKRLPIDTLKIDRSLVRDIPDDPNDEAIARAVVALGHSLGLNVIAEGVETRIQENVLRDTGCDQLQGYLYGRPMPADDFARLLSVANMAPHAKANTG